MTDRIILEASEGMILTDGECYGYIIYLGTEDDADNWYEITIEEYEAKQKELEDDEEIDYQSAYDNLAAEVIGNETT